MSPLPLRARMASDPSRAGDTLTAEFLTFVGAVVTFAVLVAGICLVFWQSDREWGGLPSANGPGAVLYVGVVAGITAGIAFVTWSFLAWRNSRSTP
jgi:drug/metabolite transporter (DMT)-like permease